MTFLVLDTSMPLATLAVVEGAHVLGSHTLSEPKRHAESLADALDRALLLAGRSVDQLRGVGVGCGPGSFIGVRTGIAFSKGLALGRGIPLVGLPTLMALAWSADASLLVDGEGLVAIDAKRGELFVQRVTSHGGELVAVGAPEAIGVDVMRERARRAAFVIGNARELLADQSGGQVGAGGRLIHLEGPTAAGLARALVARVAHGVDDEVDTLVPDYRRDADAKLPSADPSARRATLLGG